MREILDRFFDAPAEFGRTDAVVVRHHNEIVVERYGSGLDASTTLRSWSMAKSMLHAAVGILVSEGSLDVDARADVAEWEADDDPRRAISLRHLLTMRAGLQWVEGDIIKGQLPDSVTMMYGNNKGPMHDTAAWAANRRLADAPGSAFNYSSGSSMLLSRIVRDVVGSGSRYEQWLRQRFFEPTGMMSAKPRFDAAGTWLASSFCFATAADFSAFGQLYLDGGMANGVRVLPTSWTDTAAVATGHGDDGKIHTMHWWRFGDADSGAFQAVGYQGQHIVVVPSADLVVVRLGETPEDHRHHVGDALRDLVDAYAVR